MSAGGACREPSHRPYWVVVGRKCNHSAFNGYNRSPSDYSAIWCRVESCRRSWRTKANYVADLPDGSYRDPTVSPGTIVASASAGTAKRTPSC